MEYPQGSVLGPLLFIVYLLGIAEVFNKHSIDYVMYADDIQCFTSTSTQNLDSTLRRLERCIAEVKDWLEKHKLLLNTSKTECILLGSRQMLERCSNPSLLQLNGSSVKFSPVVRDLGVLIDSQLTFHSHSAIASELPHSFPSSFLCVNP